MKAISSHEAITFEDDAAWLDWAADNPEAYALNIRSANDPGYVVLHRASCSSIIGARAEGAYTERSYRKVGGASIESLRRWVALHRRPGGTFSKRCGRCVP